jgi:hypothetical protein
MHNRGCETVAPWGRLVVTVQYKYITILVTVFIGGFTGISTGKK